MPNLVLALFFFDAGNSVRVSQRFRKKSEKGSRKRNREREGDFMTKTEAKGDVEVNGS
jgi:hypothetical protein